MIAGLLLIIVMWNIVIKKKTINEMYFRCNSTVKQHIQFVLGGGTTVVKITTVVPPSKMYGGTTVLFHDDNGPPPEIGGGLLSGTWGDYCRENPDSGPPST